MLSKIRKTTQGVVGAVLLGLLIISFAVFGTNDAVRGSISNYVAMVGHEGITQEQFRREFDRVLKQVSAQAGREVTTAEAREQGLDKRALDELASDRAFGAFTDHLGIRPSVAQVREAISGIPAFQDPATHRFSEAAYQNALSQNGFTTTDFETRVRSDLARQTLLTAALAGIKAPHVMGVQALAFATEQRTVTIIPIAASSVGGPRTPTDAQIQTFYTENADALKRPESRDLTLISADMAHFVSGAQVNEAQLRQLYQAQRAQLTTPAKRSFTQIVAPDRAKAEQALARLRSGQTAQAVARSLSLDDPLVFADSAASQIPDSKVADAVIAAHTGDMFVVEGALGFAAIRVTGETAPVVASFEDFAVNARQQMRQQAASAAMTAATEAYDAAIEEGQSPADAAKRAGFTVTVVPNVLPQGMSEVTRQPVPALEHAQQGLTQAFQLPEGEATDLMPAGENVYLAIVVTKIHPSAAPPLAEIRGDLIGEWQRRDLTARLQAKANEVLERARKDGLEVAARAFGLNTQTPPTPLTRGQGGPALTNAVFGAEAGGIVSAPVGNGVEYAIIRVNRITRDDETAAADRVTQANQQITQMLQNDLVAAIGSMAREQAHVQLWEDRLGAAFGDAQNGDQDGNKGKDDKSGQ